MKAIVDKKSRIEKISKFYQQENKNKNGTNFIRLFWVFILCSILGYLLEMGWCYLYHGYFESRKSLLYGPFSIIYGLGAVLIVLLIHSIKKINVVKLYLFTVALGTAFEYFCSLFQEKLFGTVSWNYGNKPYSIGGRANILFAFAWALMAVLLLKNLLPMIDQYIRCVMNNKGKILTTVVLIFMVVNVFLSGVAVKRQVERRQDIPPANRFEAYIDTKYPDEVVNKVYANMRMAGTSLTNSKIDRMREAGEEVDFK